MPKTDTRSSHRKRTLAAPIATDSRLTYLVTEHERRFITVLRVEFTPEFHLLRKRDQEGAIAAFRQIATRSVALNTGMLWHQAEGVVLAHWGRSVHAPDSPRSAVDTAISIAKALLGAELRIAIDCGIGTVERNGGTWIGGPAAQSVEMMCMSAPAGMIIATDVVRRSCGDLLSWRARGRHWVPIPNRGPPSQLWSGQPPAAGDPLASDAVLRIDGLGPLKPWLQLASVLDPEISVDHLARLTRRPPDSVAAILADLGERGVLTETGGAWRLSSPADREAAYAGLTYTARSRIHSAMAAILADCEHPPEAVARQFEAAEEHRSAARTWLDAARRANHAGRPHAALGFLDRADRAAAAGAEADDISLDVMRLRVTQFIQVEGNGAASVRRSLDAADAIAKACRKSERVRFDLAWLRQSYRLVRADMTSASPAAAHLMTVAETIGGDDTRLLARRLLAIERLLTGRSEEAIELYRSVLDAFDHERDAELRHAFVSDQAALTHAHLALSYAYVNRPAPSAAQQYAALRCSTYLQHPHTSAHVMAVLALAAQIRGDAAVAISLATATAEYAAHHGFAYWHAWAEVVCSWHVSLTAPIAGAFGLRRAIDLYRATGAEQITPHALGLLASALSRAGCYEDARTACATQRELIDSLGLELYRARADEVAAAVNAAAARVTRSLKCRIPEQDLLALKANRPRSRQPK